MEYPKKKEKEGLEREGEKQLFYYSSQRQRVLQRGNWLTVTRQLAVESVWSGSMEVTVGDCSEILVVLGSGTWEVKKNHSRYRHERGSS